MDEEDRDSTPHQNKGDDPRTEPEHFLVELLDGSSWVVVVTLEFHDGCDGTPSAYAAWNPFPIQNRIQLDVIEAILCGCSEKWQQLVSHELILICLRPTI